MKRFRLSTLMLLVVIAALGIALVVQEVRHRRREAEQEARLAALKQQHALERLVKDMEKKFLDITMSHSDRSTKATGGASDGK